MPFLKCFFNKWFSDPLEFLFTFLSDTAMPKISLPFYLSSTVIDGDDNFFPHQMCRVLFLPVIGASNPVQHRKAVKKQDLAAIKNTFSTRICKMFLCL